MRVILAPMEGVLDHLMRELLTEMNHYDLCVTEFVRVVDMLLPNRVFHRFCPELKQGGKTKSGTPVRVQLLGQHAQWMAENALRAIELGSPGVDVNFGCPAKTVNKSQGGAAMLREPESLYQVVSAMRKAVPADQPVTAKIRLGWDSTEYSLEIADAVAQAGASELAVHGRTKSCGYKADKIDWPAIGAIQSRLNIPVIANGEIWNYQDGIRCRQVTGCDALMVGRGALNLPNIGNVLKEDQEKMPWLQVTRLLSRYAEMECRGDKGIYFPNRIKQWMSYLKKEYQQGEVLFAKIRSLKDSDEIVSVINNERLTAQL